MHIKFLNILKDSINYHCQEFIGNNKNSILSNKVITGVSGILRFMILDNNQSPKNNDQYIDYIYDLERDIDIYAQNIKKYLQVSNNRDLFNNLNDAEKMIFLSCIAIGVENQNELIIPVKKYSKEQLVNESIEQNNPKELRENHLQEIEDIIKELIEEYAQNIESEGLEKFFQNMISLINNKRKIISEIIKAIKYQKLEKEKKRAMEIIGGNVRESFLVTKVKYLMKFIGKIAGVNILQSLKNTISGDSMSVDQYQKTQEVSKVEDVQKELSQKQKDELFKNITKDDKQIFEEAKHIVSEVSEETQQPSMVITGEGFTLTKTLMGWSLEASEAGITNIRKLTGDNSKFQGHESGLSMTLDNSEASKIIGSLSNNIKIDFDSKGLPPHNPDRQKSLM
jgi:hypothetical protein